MEQNLGQNSNKISYSLQCTNRWMNDTHSYHF